MKEVERLREQDRLNREAELLNLANLILDHKGGNRKQARTNIENRLKEINKNG